MRRQRGLRPMSSIECRSNASLPISSWMSSLRGGDCAILLSANRAECVLICPITERANTIWKAAQLIGRAWDYRQHAFVKLFVNDHLSKRSQQVALSSKWVNLVFGPFCRVALNFLRLSSLHVFMPCSTAATCRILEPPLEKGKAQTLIHQSAVFATALVLKAT